MISYLWLSRFILLATVASPSLSSLFDLEINSFWNNRAPDIEALDFFQELEKDEQDLRGSQRSGVTNVTTKPAEKKPTKSTEKHHLKRRRGGHVAAAKRELKGSTLDTALKEVKARLTFSGLTDAMFNGQDFEMDEDIVHEEGKSVLKASLKAKLGLPLPGGDLVFEEKGGKQTLVVKVSESEATFKAAYIKMEGKAYFSNLDTFKVDIVIEKKSESEVFEITTFDVTGQAVNLTNLLGEAVDVINQFSDLGLKTDYIDKLKAEFSAFTGFGAFNKDTLQLVIHLDSASSITRSLSAKSISLLIAQSGEGTSRQFSVFVTVENFISKLASLFNQTDIFDENFLLKHIDGDVCLFLVSHEIEYLDPIKSDDRLLECFGDQEDEKAATAFAKVEAGLHANIKVDFKEALEQGCWGGNDLPSEVVDKIGTVIQIYGKITRNGVNARILSDVTVPTNVMLACFSGLMTDAPEYLTKGEIKLKQLTRVKAAGENGEMKNHWTISIALTPHKDFNTLPGTTISLKNFELDADGNEGDASSWNVEAKMETQIGRESNLDFSIKKEGSEYFIEAQSSKLTLGDLLSAFSVPPVGDTNSQGVLSTLGVKDFSFSMKFGKELEEHEFLVNGKPIIFGFDKLEIAAIIKKTNPNAVSSGKKKAAVVKRDGDNDSGGSGGSGNSSSSDSSLKYTIGLYLNGADFTPMMKNVFGRDDIDLQWLGGLKAIVVFTNMENQVVLKNNEAEDVEDGEAADGGVDRKKRLAIGKLTKRHRKVGKKAKKVKKIKKIKKLKKIKKIKKIKKEAASVTNITTPRLPQALERRKFMGTKRHEDPERNDDEPETGDDDAVTSDDDTETSDDEAEKSELKFDELHAELHDKEIEKPISFAIYWTIPTEDKIDTCHDNPLCKWMVVNLKNEDSTPPSMYIKGELSRSSFKLEAGISMKAKIIDTINETLTFTEMSLAIEVGMSMPKIEISAEMEYENIVIGASGENKLKFRGTISATPISMSLLFTMDGFVFPKFGQDAAYIGIGNVYLGGGYSGGVPSFTFGASIKLGLFESPPESEHAIVITGNFGVSVGNPKENWVYGSISALNIDAVCTAFKLECGNMPPNLKSTGFPYGISASFSNKERDVIGVGTIPEGLQIKGTINIFGFECHTELSMKKTGGGYTFSILVEMSPLDWGNGMIQVSRSTDDKENGPIASATISTGSPADFEFCIEGYANALSILEANVTIKITAEMFEFKIGGYLIPAFLSASLEITANYGDGGNGDDPLFSFVATVSIQFQEKLKKIIVDFMKQLQERVKEAMDAAKEKLQNATLKVEEAQAKMEGWKRTIEGWKNALEKRKKDLEDEMKPPPCDCPQVCFPFLDWDSKCWKVWGYWVGCPYWNSCFRMVDDIFCKAGCAIKKVINTIIRWAKQAILSLGQLILSGVQGLITLAQGILDLAKGVLAVCQGVLSFAESAINGALQMAEEAFLALVEQFELRLLLLKATLTADYSACVGYEYNLTFFGKDQEGAGEACLDLKSLSGSLLGGVTENDTRTKGTTKTPERLKEIDSESKEVIKAETELSDKEEAAGSTITEHTSETFDEPETTNIPTLKKYARALENVPRHHHVPTREEMEMIKLANKKIPRFNIKGDHGVRSFVKNSPWKLPERHIPIGHNETVRREETETGQKRTLDFDSNLTPCRRMKRALEGYSDLTNGIIKYSYAVQQSTNSMKKSRIANTEKLDEFQRSLQVAESKYNMTSEDKEDAYYVYNNLAHRHEELVRKSQIAAHTEDAYAMPIIRRQINHLLEKEKGSTFMKFTDIMHLNAVEGYKRSQIPHPADIQGEQILGNIKQDLQAIVTNEDSALTPMTPRLQNVKRNIIAMSDYVKQCRDN